MSRSPSDRREAQLSESLATPSRREREGGKEDGEKKMVCELVPFEIATASLPVPGTVAELLAAAPHSSFAVSKCHCSNLRSFEEPLFVHRE